MGTTGLIFAAIAVAWLAYLVPHFVRRRDDEAGDELEVPDRFADSMRIIRNGTAPLLDQDLERIPRYEVSTPQTRRAAIRDLHRQQNVAASRRRRVLLVLLAGLSLMVGLCAVGLTRWWTLAIPGGLLLAFVVVARLSVGMIRRSLDARYEQIRNGNTESTIFLSRDDLARVTAGGAKEPTVGVDLKVRADGSKTGGALWDPVPITKPTYVSKPLAPRTVRTIDLSGPTVAATARASVPVTADPPEDGAEAAEEAGGDEQRAAASA